MSKQKRTAALATAAALAGSAVLLAAPAARAEVVDVDYACKTPIGDKSAVSPIDIKGVRNGSGYRITMSWQKGVSSSPVELGKGAMSPSATIKVGGADSGPSPYDLLLAGLGACTGMTLKMYAERKGWPLEEVTVRLKHGKVHALDEQRVGEPGARVDRVERELRLEGTLDDEQRARLLEIANKCPVHRTLEAGVHTVTALAGDGAAPASLP